MAKSNAERQRLYRLRKAKKDKKLLEALIKALENQKEKK